MEVLATGALNTVQDSGRRGLRKFGISVAGPLDTLAAATGNAMLGNSHDAAFIEVLLFPLRLRFHSEIRITLTGADARATLDGRPVLPWWSLLVRSGQELTLQGPLQGGVTYLCVAGGIDVPLILDSRSTDLKANFGGFGGRTLRKGDQLSTTKGASCASITTRPSHSNSFGVVSPTLALAPIAPTTTADLTLVRVLPASEWSLFSQATRARFLSTEWTISPQSNRIGMRLEGPVLKPRHALELLSHGIVPGVIQLPPSGQPIVMQCDAQTSGGYPKIATVIEADQWRVAQSRLGGRLQFVVVDMAQALTAWQERQTYLSNVRRAAELVS